MSNIIDHILQDLYALDPSLKEVGEERIRAIVAALLRARPNATPDPAFVDHLRRQLLRSDEAPAAAPSLVPLWYTLMLRTLTPVAAIALVLVILLPTVAPSPAPYGTSFDSRFGGGGDFGGGGGGIPGSSMMQSDGGSGVATKEAADAENDMALMYEAPEERTIGFIRSVDPTSGVITFDDARWLSGFEGEDAAIRAGVCTEETRGECLPNGYFIENRDRTAVRLTLDPAHTIIMQTWQAGSFGVMPREIDLATFATLMNDTSLHYRELPYTLTFTGTLITSIEEVYIP